MHHDRAGLGVELFAPGWGLNCSCLRQAHSKAPRRAARARGTRGPCRGRGRGRESGTAILLRSGREEGICIGISGRVLSSRANCPSRLSDGGDAAAASLGAAIGGACIGCGSSEESNVLMRASDEACNARGDHGCTRRSSSRTRCGRGGRCENSSVLPSSAAFLLVPGAGRRAWSSSRCPMGCNDVRMLSSGALRAVLTLTANVGRGAWHCRARRACTASSSGKSPWRRAPLWAITDRASGFCGDEAGQEAKRARVSD